MTSYIYPPTKPSLNQADGAYTYMYVWLIRAFRLNFLRFVCFCIRILTHHRCISFGLAYIVPLWLWIEYIVVFFFKYLLPKVSHGNTTYPPNVCLSEFWNQPFDENINYIFIAADSIKTGDHIKCHDDFLAPLAHSFSLRIGYYLIPWKYLEVKQSTHSLIAFMYVSKVAYCLHTVNQVNPSLGHRHASL